MKMTDLERQDIKRIAELPYGWEKLKDSTILISGGSGFIGSLLTSVIEERNKGFGDNINVISLSRRPHKNSEYVRYVTGDVTLPIDIPDELDYIIHLASNTHPAQYSSDPVGTITTNIFGCYNLLELCRKKNVKRLLLASSVEIYGNGVETAMDEKFCGYIDCNTVRAGYNESKRVSESLCQSFKHQYGVDFVTARLARVFGADRKKDTKAMAQFMERAVCGEDIILKSAGSQRFSYCYVADAVGGLLKILLDGKNGEAYNIADDYDGKTLGEYAEYIADLAGKKVIFDINEDVGASKSDYAVVSCDKLKSIGWKPLYSVEEGLKKTYSILKENGAWL